MYNEDDFLQLSGIQHFVFCRRQWALAYIEQQWQENVRTLEGHLLHELAHDAERKEKRGECIIVRGMRICSREIGISGECDVVEFHKASSGISLVGREGMYEVIPIEYKRGAPKVHDADSLQVAAEALCLEEMLCCDIPYAYLYYGEIRRREKVEISTELRQKVRAVFAEMHKYYEQRYTPKVKISKSCNACSLKDLCLPVLNKHVSVKSYLDSRMKEGE